MFCPNCGNKIVSSNNYCIRCGYSLQSNTTVSNSVNVTQNSNASSKNNNISYTRNYSSDSGFVVTNMIIYVLVILLIFLFLFSVKESTLVLVVAISFSISYFYFVCYQKLLIKAGLPWWGMFVPMYNVYLMNKLSFGNGLYMFVPIILTISAYFNLLLFKDNLTIAVSINSIIYIVVYIFPVIQLFCLGRKFGRSGIITALFSFVVIPTIAFSDKYDYLG